ncbi:hypothetical protein [Nostoc sp.]
MTIAAIKTEVAIAYPQFALELVSTVSSKLVTVELLTSLPPSVSKIIRIAQRLLVLAGETCQQPILAVLNTSSKSFLATRQSGEFRPSPDVAGSLTLGEYRVGTGVEDIFSPGAAVGTTADDEN